MSAMRKKQQEETEEKVLDVNANMHGTLSFEDPVNLKINGQFEGELDSKGMLTISKTAYVKAKIVGDSISIAGKVEGNIEAKKDLRLMAGARIEGDITTPILSVEAGAVFEGRCNMSSRQEAGGETLSIGGLASHLNLEPAEVVKLADSGKIPGSKAGDQWTFKKKEIDTWLANQK